MLDICNYMRVSKYSILEAEVSTSDNMASDILLVQQQDGNKIDKPRKFAEDVRDVILRSNAHVERQYVQVDASPSSPLQSSRGKGNDDGDGDAPLAGVAPEVVMKSGTDGGGDEVFKVHMGAGRGSEYESSSSSSANGGGGRDEQSRG